MARPVSRTSWSTCAPVHRCVPEADALHARVLEPLRHSARAEVASGEAAAIYEGLRG